MKLFVVQVLRKLCCVVLGFVLGIGIPLALEQWLPGYKYYGEMNE